jgi:hypothetical protein
MSDSQTDDVELVNLLKEMETMAHDLVEKAGGYPPFGGTIDDKGKIGLLVHQAAIGGGGDAGITNKVADAVRQAARPPNIRAAALAGMGYVNDPETQQKTTATVITLHHRSGRNVDYVTPFSKAASGAIRWGKSFAGLSQTKLF